MKRILILLFLLLLVGGGLTAFWFLKPDLANRTLDQVVEYLNSPRVRGFRWPSLEEGRFTVTFQEPAVPRDYAEAVMKIATISGTVLDEKLGRSFFHDIDIFLFIEEGRSYLWNNGKNEIHVVFADTNDMLPPGVGGERNHVGRIAQQLGLLVAQVRSGPENLPTPNDQATAALANYLEMKLLVPAIWRRGDKDLLWPAPYNYLANNGPEAYARFAADPPSDMRAGRFWSRWDTFWFRLDKIGGPEAVGQVLNQAAGPVGHTDVAGLIRAVESVTDNQELVDLLKELQGSS